MPQPISQEKRAEWKDKIIQQKKSGKNINQWCLENRVHPRAFYYWKSKFFPKIIDRSCFTELTNIKDTGITIEYQEVRIFIDRNFDLTTLKHCLVALRGMKC